MNEEMNCNYGSVTDNELGPLNIDYYYLYYCLPIEIPRVVLLIGLVLWFLWLIHLLTQTAANYFSPTLGKICEKFQLPHDLAGVTLLALGNGAPDLFSIIASFKKSSEDPSVGIGAILGASIFTATVTIGSIAISCPCHVPRMVFIRDCSAHLLSAITVALFALLQLVSPLLSCVLLLLYVVYIIIVVASPSLQCYDSQDMAIIEDMGGGPVSPFQQEVITPKETVNTYDSNLICRILSDDNNDSYCDACNLENLEREESLTSERRRPEQTEKTETTAESKKEGDKVRNDAKSVLFTAVDLEENQQLLEKHPLAILPPTSSSSQRKEENPTAAYGTFGEEGRKRSTSSSSASTHQHSHRYHLHHHSHRSNPQTPNSSLSRPLDLYSLVQYNITMLFTSYIDWKQFALQRRFHHEIIKNEWEKYSYIYCIYYCFIEFPITLLRDLTIPSLEDNHWNKLYAVCHPFLDCFAIVGLLYGFNTTILGFSTFYVTLLLGSILSFLMYCLTSHHHFPVLTWFDSFWMILAFIMSVLWTYLFAEEIVTCLTAFGYFTDISPAFLGITILAWGNAMGDYCTNLAIAKQGYGRMAIAGSNAGPVFNILLGFGISLLFTSWKCYPKPYAFHIDSSLAFSLIYLIFVLALSLIILFFRSFQFDYSVGIILILLYIVYTVIQISLIL
jgi:sodium/potassium/calcium exchanger 6